MCFDKYFAVKFLPRRVVLVNESLFNSIFWKLQLCDCLSSRLLLFYTKAGTRPNCSISREMANDGQSNNTNDLYAFSQLSLIGAQMLLLQIAVKNSFWYFAVWCLRGLQISFEQIYWAFAVKPDKLFWTEQKKMNLVFLGKNFEHLELREKLCVQSSKVSNFSAGRGYTIIRERIRWFYSNVINCLFVPRNQPKNYHLEEILHLHTSQKSLIRVPILP